MSSPTYLLDNNVLSHFFNAGRKQDLAAIAAAIPLVVVEEVHKEALRHRTRGEEYRKWQSSSALEVRSILVGSRGATCLGRLRKDTDDMKDLGEHASIALAVEDPSLMFTLNDNKGTLLALRHLVQERERVVPFSAFLHRAQAMTGIGATAMQAVAEEAGLAGRPPIWWADWLATLPP